MMKAYLSDREFGHSDRITLTRAGVDGPQMAHAEARRILGETEPGSVRTAHASPRFYGTGHDADYAASALAESLAAILPVLAELEAEAGK